jgi:hypothetical protein
MVYIFHVKVMKKVACILRMGKGKLFLGLQYSEAKKTLQIT